MSYQGINLGINNEVPVIATIIMSILIYNDLFVYKRSIRDNISVMLFFGIFLGIFETMWECFDGNLSMKSLTYIGAIGYGITLFFFALNFNRFFLGLFNLLPRNKLLIFLYYHLPSIIISALCISTPWTNAIFIVDKSGYIVATKMFVTVYYGAIWIYVLSAIVPAVFYSFQDEKRDPAIVETAKSVVIFGIMMPILYLLQTVEYRGLNDDNINLSIVIAIGLVYLIIRVNTRLLLLTRSQIDAVEADLHAAAKIQSDALPSVDLLMKDVRELNNGDRLELYASMTPAKDVGGDFYDFFMIDDDHLGLVMADVSEKGIPAAMFMMSSKSILANNAMMGKSPSQVLEDTNRAICTNNREQMFVTVWFGILEISTGIIKASNGGHEYPIIKHSPGKYEVIKDRHSFVLGFEPGKKYTEYEMKLEPGAKLFLYTDGAVEATDPNMKMFGINGLVNVLDQVEDASPKDTIDAVKKAIKEYEAGGDQFDDLTMLCLEYK
ncbi:MAG: serine/threonine-protein phosphatase [Lachnospiraceae bacterium]|nr:serine/threonine-protein phosphatase [Lachnospiraceae bacterium]